LRYFRSKSNLRQRFHELPTSFFRLARGRLVYRVIFFFPLLVWSVIEFLILSAVVAVLWLFMVTAGFGFKPRRLATFVVGAVVGFTGLYYVDDTLIGSCACFSWNQLASSAYSSVTSLTSLGLAPSPCGPFTGILVSMETLGGYFLLSILAAMFFAWLTDR
jgi:hypothetical protein